MTNNITNEQCEAFIETFRENEWRGELEAIRLGLEAAVASVKNVDTSPERDKKGDDSLHVERLALVLRQAFNAWDEPDDLFVVQAGAILAEFPHLSRDIAAEIEAERQDMGEGVGDVYYAQGLQRAAEIARRGR